MPEWLAPTLRIIATAAAAAGVSGIGVHQWDQGAPVRAELELAELRLEAEERAALRAECQGQLERERELLDRAQAETRHFVERCTSLVTGEP